MKKYSLIIIAALTAFAACSQEKALDAPVATDPEEPVVVEDNPGEAEPITITASLPETLTKVTFTPGADGSGNPILALTWKKGDTLRVADHADSSRYTDFVLSDESAGSKKGVFTGTPVSASSYDVSVVYDAVEINAQAQPGDGDAGYLRYIAEVKDITDLSTINFTSISGALALIATMPSKEIAAVIKSVVITASNDIFDGGNTMTITFDSVGDAGGDGVLTFYATLPGTQAIPAGTTLLMKFNAPDESHDVYTRLVTIPSAASFLSGKLNVLATDCRGVATHAGSYTATDGSEEHPYLVGDKYQLAAISSELSTTEKTYFELIDDITVSSWTSIDCDTKGAISLNGNNKTISGLKKPLFEYLDGNIANLILSNATIEGGNYYGVLIRTINKDACSISNITVDNSSVSGGFYLGGLIGYIASNSCYISNCSTNVSVTSTTSYARSGGLIGHIQGAEGYVTKVENCSSQGSVTASSGQFIGGLIGEIMEGYVTLEKCHSTGDVVCNNHYAGGLIGQITGTNNTINKCYSESNLIVKTTNLANFGGLVGLLEGDASIEIQDCYSTGSITPEGDGISIRRWCGGFIGRTNANSTTTITNGYSTSTFGGTSNCGALIGTNSGSVTCSGFVGWSSHTALAGAGTSIPTDGNYLGIDAESSIYSEALALGGWDFSKVWTTDPTPQLR